MNLLKKYCFFLIILSLDLRVFCQLCNNDINSICLDLQKPSFFTNLPAKYSTKESQIKCLNTYINEKQIFEKQIEAKFIDNKKGIGLFATEEIKEFDKVTRIELLQTLNSKTLKPTQFFPSKFVQFQKQNRLQTIPNFYHEYGSNYYTNSKLKFIFILWYHFLNLNDSIFYPEFLNFPKDIESPLLTLTEYEIATFISQLGLDSHVMKHRKKLKNSFKLFEKLVKSHFSNEQLLAVLGNNTLEFTDFTYLVQIMMTRSYMIELLENEIANTYYFVYPIANFFNCINKMDLSLTQYYFPYPDFKRSLRETQQMNFFQIISPIKHKTGDEILLSYGIQKNYKTFFKYGFLQDYNYLDCFNIKFVSKQYARKYRLEEEICLEINTLQKIVNYDKEELEDCQFSLEKGQNFSYHQTIQDKIDIVLDYQTVNAKCDKPTSQKIRLFQQPLKSLEKLKAQFSALIQSVIDEEATSQVPNSKLIISIMKNYLNLSEQLIENIHQLEN